MGITPSRKLSHQLPTPTFEYESEASLLKISVEVTQI